MNYTLLGSSAHGILQARVLPGMGCHCLLHGTFLIQALNPGLLHCRKIIYCLSMYVNSWLLEKAIAPHSSTSCLENPMDRGTWEAVVYGVAKSLTWLSDFSFTFHFHTLEKERATHSSVLAWRIPGMVEPGGLPSMGSHRVGHDWSDLAAAAGYSWLFIFFVFKVEILLSQKEWTFLRLLMISKYC